MKKNELNEEAIVTRMSNGELSALYGGLDYVQPQCGVVSPALGKCQEQPSDPLCNCLAGCGCIPSQTACDTCTAAI